MIPSPEIANRISALSQKKVMLGLDGFIDTIVRVIRSSDATSTTSYFSSVGEFGKYILGKGEKNFSIEYETVMSKIGGNMPIMANAFAQLGITPSCLGCLGFPQIHPIFNELQGNSQLFSFANPGFTKAIELNGPKIMLAEMGDLNNIDWETIKERIGVDSVNQLFTGSDLVCLLNWSEINFATKIWKGLLADVLSKIAPTEKKPIGFFDLSDCSKRSPNSIREALDLLKEFSIYWKMVLSLNLNEAINLNTLLTGKILNENSLDEIGENIYKRVSISQVVIHCSKQAMVWDEHGIHQCNSIYLTNPKLSTGAGDNFNAGYCVGILMDLETEDSLWLGHLVSHHYMKHGKSATTLDLMHLLSGTA